MINVETMHAGPTASLLFPQTSDPAFPDVGDAGNPKTFEEQLRMDLIQGNVIDGGFNKDYQTILCLSIDNVTNFKAWLKAQLPQIATASEVLTFNRLFKELRTRRGEPVGIKATWTNIAFSFRAVKLLTSPQEADQFIDQPFKDGLAKRAVLLGDPTDPQAEGNPANWVVGGDDNEPDVLMIIASDDYDDMAVVVDRIVDSIENSDVASGASVSFQELGANLTGDLAGHEHFGTRDGISQPGVRGRISGDPHAVLTPRQNPEKVDAEGNRIQGKPGQELLWPGEFVFGYPAQNPKADSLEESKGAVRKAVNTIDPDVPHWTDNGSFLVFRRLRQDVFTFHSFLKAQADDLALNPLLVSAKLVGRWESGTPTVRSPNADTPAMAMNDCSNNDFEFNSGVDTPDSKHGPNDCDDRFREPTFPKDDATDPPSIFATGQRCPFDAHTRKTYPRNDLTPAGTAAPRPADRPDKSEADTQTHRLMRRGIPFGDASSSTPANPVPDDVDRGLHFLAYQTSIEKQFEFVTRRWVNNPTFSTEAATGHGCGGELPTGFDPIIGQNNTVDGDRSRSFVIQYEDNGGAPQCAMLTTADDWVIPTGGGYFFTPSITALELFSE